MHKLAHKVILTRNPYSSRTIGLLYSLVQIIFQLFRNKLIGIYNEHPVA